MHYLYIPAEVLQKLGGGFKHRLVCTVNSNLNFQGGTVALGDGAAYITLSKARMKKLGLELGNEVIVKLEKDDSEFGVVFPEELTEILAQDEEAYARFNALKEGMKRYILYYIGQVKSSEKRLERSVFLMHNLKKTIPGKEEFRNILGKD